jgi:hypothetical protein
MMNNRGGVDDVGVIYHIREHIGGQKVIELWKAWKWTREKKGTIDLDRLDECQQKNFALQYILHIAF